MNGPVPATVEKLKWLWGRLTTIWSYWPARAVAYVYVLWKLHGEMIVEHFKYAKDMKSYNEDAVQQIVPFFQFHGQPQFANDYISSYYYDLFPIGYKALFTALSTVYDPTSISKVLPHVLWFTFAGCLAFAGRRLAGWWSGLASASFVLGSAYVLSKLGGGLPRSFAFPLLGGGVAMLAAGRLKWLAVLVPLAAAFYPVSSVILGLTLAVAAILMPQGDRGDIAKWSLLKRSGLVAASALATALVVAPNAAGSRKYGHIISSDPESLEKFPEAGRGGRYTDNARAPWAGYQQEMLKVYRHTFARRDKDTPDEDELDEAEREGNGRGKKGKHGKKGKKKDEPKYVEDQQGLLPALSDWVYEDIYEDEPMPPYMNRQRWTKMLDILFVLGLVGAGFLAVSKPAARRVLIVAATAFFGHVVSRSYAPFLYLPERYVVYPGVIMMLLFVPAGTAEIARRIGERFRLGGANVAAAAMIVLICFAGTKTLPGSGIKHEAQHRKVIKAIGRLPKDSLIAGFPGRTSIIDDVPYLARRPVLISFESHQAFHVEYVKEMRRRARDVFDATWATSLDPLIHLRDAYGVTHFVFNRQTIKLTGRGPAYFKPFGDDIWAARSAAEQNGGELELLRLADTPAAVYEKGNFVIIDLSQID